MKALHNPLNPSLRQRFTPKMNLTFKISVAYVRPDKPTRFLLDPVQLKLHEFSEIAEYRVTLQSIRRFLQLMDHYSSNLLSPSHSKQFGDCPVKVRILEPNTGIIIVKSCSQKQIVLCLLFHFLAKHTHSSEGTAPRKHRRSKLTVLNFSKPKISCAQILSSCPLPNTVFLSCTRVWCTKMSGQQHCCACTIHSLIMFEFCYK